MGRPTYYFFNRYQLSINGEILESSGQLALMSDNQGQNFAIGKSEDNIIKNVLCADPRKFMQDGYRVIVAEIGYIPGFREVQKYNEKEKKKELTFQRDDHTKFGQAILVPSLGAIALRNKKNDSMIAALQTKGMFKKFVDRSTNGEGELDILGSEDDTERAFENWDITKFSWTVRPLNPSGSALAKRRSAAMEEENVMRESGTAVPWEEGSLELSEEGRLRQTKELADAGYGQYGVEGMTEDGHKARIQKPKFHMDKNKNIKEREGSHSLQVAFNSDETDQGDIERAVASALIAFYGKHGSKNET